MQEERKACIGPLNQMTQIMQTDLLYITGQYSDDYIGIQVHKATLSVALQNNYCLSRADDIKNDEFDRKNMGKCAG